MLVFNEVHERPGMLLKLLHPRRNHVAPIWMFCVYSTAGAQSATIGERGASSRSTFDIDAKLSSLRCGSFRLEGIGPLWSFGLAFAL